MNKSFRLKAFNEAVSFAPAFLVLLLFFVQGGRSQSVWGGVAALLLLLGAWTVWTGLNQLWTKINALPLFGFFFLGTLVSFSQAPCTLDAFRSVTKLAAAGCVALVVLSTWEERHRRFFRFVLWGACGVQVALLVVSRFGGVPFQLLLPGNSQYIAFCLCVGTLSALEDSLKKGRSLGPRLLGIGMACSFLGTVILLFSRSGVLSLAAGFLFLASKRGVRVGVFAGLALLSILVLVPSRFVQNVAKQDDPLAWKRTEIWGAALKGIVARPLVGWGPGHFQTLYQAHAPPQELMPVRYDLTTPFAHNDYLQAGGEYGLPATLFLLWGILSLFMGHNGISRVRGRAAIFGAAVFSLFNFPFYLPINGLILACFLEKDDAPLKTEPVDFLSFSWSRLLFTGSFCLLAVGNLYLSMVSFGLIPKAGTFLWDPDRAVKEADLLSHSGSPTTLESEMQAEELLKRTVRSCPNHAKAWYDLAHLYAVHRRPPNLSEAEAALRQALLWKPFHAPWVLELSDLFLREGDPEGATQLARRALALEPRYAEAALRVGSSLRQAGNPVQAERWLTDYLRRCSSRAPLREEYSSYAKTVLAFSPELFFLELTRCSLDQGDGLAALRILSNVPPDSPEVLFLKAGAFHLLGKEAESKGFLRAAARLDPENALYLKRLGSSADLHGLRRGGASSKIGR